MEVTLIAELLAALVDQNNSRLFCLYTDTHTHRLRASRLTRTTKLECFGVIRLVLRCLQIRLLCLVDIRALDLFSRPLAKVYADTLY